MKHDWGVFAQETGQALRERLDRLASVTAEDRQQIVQRLEQTIQNALEVPIDLEQQVEESAARLIARSPDTDLVAIAWERTRERARRSAAIGAVTTIPALLPGLGTALAALGLVADWRYVAEQQRNLVLEIAALFGQWPDDATAETRALFLAATATAFAAPGAGRLVTRVLARQVARRGIARLLPGAGATLAGALNYIATIALGRAAIEHFGARAGFEVHGLVPAQAHPALPWLRSAIVDAIETGREADLFSVEARRACSELAPAEREELIDLSAALTLARGRNPRRNQLMKRIGSALDFPPAEVERMVKRAVRSTKPVQQRVRHALSRAVTRGASSTESVWRQVARLARRRGPGRRSRRNTRRSD
jgi:hypothetical protein